MTTRASRRKASRSGSRPDPAVVHMLTSWSIDHPGDFRLYAPHLPRSEDERVAVYVVTPPEPAAVDGPSGPAGARSGPLVRLFSMTGAEMRKLADDLGLGEPGE
jgi:hypothetical protein